jgi:hypothetical protein
MARSEEVSSSTRDRLNELSQHCQLKGLLDQRPGSASHELPQGWRLQVSGSEDEVAKEVRTVLGKPVMKLNARAVGHAKIGDYNLVSSRARRRELSERRSPIFRFIGIPSSTAEIARQRRTDRRLVVDDQRTPNAGGGDL